MSIFRKVNYIFNGRQKIQSVLLCIGLFIGALFELVGVSLIAELVKLISDPASIHTTPWKQWLYDITNASSERQFFLYAVLSLIAIYIFKNLYLTVIGYVKFTFTTDLTESPCLSRH